MPVVLHNADRNKELFVRNGHNYSVTVSVPFMPMARC